MDSSSDFAQATCFKPGRDGAERPPLDPVKLARAKVYLIEVSEHQLGERALQLQNEIEVVRDEAGLRGALARWNKALRESRGGKAVADLYLQTAWNILGWKPAARP